MPPDAVETPAVPGSPGDDLVRAYQADRRQLVLDRLRRAALWALVPIALGALVNLAVFTDRLPERLVTFAVEAALCVAAMLFARWRRVERWALAGAVTFTIGMETALLWALSISPGDSDVLVGPVASTMVAATLLFPWGVQAQVPVSLFAVTGYVALVDWSGLATARATDVWLALGLGAGTSLVGAFVLDRHRFATFAERERVEQLAHQRELLLGVGRELNGTLDLPQVVDRITRLGRRLLDCSSVSLTLVDERRRVFQVVGRSTDQPERNGDLMGAEFGMDAVGPLVDEVVRRGTLEVPNGEPIGDFAGALARRLGFPRTLYVAVQRDGRLLGFLNFSERTELRRFDEARIRLAEGIAHQAAIALANARLVDDLQTADRVKAMFVSTMSHELRTPLHVILGYADIVEEAPADERAPAAERIRSAARELLELVEATLNVNRLETGQDAPQLAEVEMRGLWDELASEFAALPRSPGVVLHWEPVPDLALRTDRRKLKIVLKNLVHNALKFTSEGEVVASCRLEGETCRLGVRDTGVGIAPEELAHVFEMFRQVDGSDVRSHGGVGLGLYIVQRLVEQLGGTVEVESAPGRGSTFTVALPSTAGAATLRAAS
jgi:signal transduction histidine kinase